jgi:hypothetical protein
MPRRDRNLTPEPHFKVRVVFAIGSLFLASRTEPRIEVDGSVVADWITDPAYGDTIGFVKWEHVVAVAWRYHGE